MTITQRFSKLSAVAAGTAVAFALIASVFATATPARAAALTSAQVSSIISLLQSFGADATTIANVQASLTGGTPTGTTGGTTTTGASCPALTRSLKQGSTGADVMALQKFLNSNAATMVAASGAGSAGMETSTFGPATKAAVMKFQTLHGVSAIGIVGPATRAAIAAACGTTGGTTGGTTPTGAGITVSAGAQPTNALAVSSASRVPFTTFSITNNSGVVQTVNGVTIQRTGFANDAVFAGLVLLNSDGTQIGNAVTLNSNHQATVGGSFTINPGQTMNLTVAGNMQNAATLTSYSGQIASIQVVAVNSTAAVSGVLPITGASHTINSTLTIGTATVGISGFDPNGYRSQAIGTTGLTFSAIRITANTEDQKLFSIRWNQTGSAGAGDITNLVTVVNGTSYPVTVDSTGKYYTANFPGGITIAKGNSIDAYLKGDLTGSTASGRTVEFDIYRSSDIYLVGQTYGFGITPTTSDTGSYTQVASTQTAGFRASLNPFYFGSVVSVTGGTLSTVSTASSVAPQNIAVNVPNQTLGGFTTNFTGEPVTVQSIVVNVATSSGSTQLQNVTLVDSNGVVVGGPVDENLVNKTITFTSSVTFPVGVMTYTIKGQVATGATTGSTYTLSTNPNTGWTSAVGQTSGTYITLPATTLTMSTMTVQSGGLNISASASPAATTISQNQNNYTVANIVLDASQSGENVRLSSLPIVVNATSSFAASILQSNLTNCQLFNGSSALNSTSVGSSQWTTKTNLAGGSGNGVEANFSFDNPLTVTKGSTVTLSLQCNVGGSFYNGLTFSAGVHPTYAPSGVTGAVSGTSISAVIPSGGSASGTMTIGTASLTASVPTPISYSQVAGGSTGVVVGTFTLQPTSGSVNLQNVGLQLNSNVASSSDLNNGVVTIWNGSTQVGTANFSGKTPNAAGYYIATSTISNVNLVQNAVTTFTLKADIASIGLGSSGTSGHEIRVGLADANGTSGNTQVDSSAATQPTTGIAVYKSFPTVALVSLPTSGVTDGRLIAFSVTANSNGPVGIGQFVYSLSTSSINTIAGLNLYAYTDAGFSSPAGGTSNGAIAGATSYNGATQYATTTIATPLEIPAGTTWYFLLKASTVTAAGGSTTYSIGTVLKGDSTDLAPSLMTAYTATTTSNFVWSPNSTGAASGVGSVDWTNGFGVNGLPSIGINQNRTQ